MLADLVPHEARFQVCRWPPSHCVVTRERERERHRERERERESVCVCVCVCVCLCSSLSFSFIRTLIPSLRLHPNIITSQRPNLQIPSHCGLGLHNMNFGGTQTFSPYHHVTWASYPTSQKLSLLISKIRKLHLI